MKLMKVDPNWGLDRLNLDLGFGDETFCVRALRADEAAAIALEGLDDDLAPVDRGSLRVGRRGMGGGDVGIS